MKRCNKALICGVLAAACLLGACNDINSSDDLSDKISDSGNNSDSPYVPGSTIFTDAELGVVSSKPSETAGFRGNLDEVTPKEGDLIATFEIEGYGTMKAVLFPEVAPVGVENFQKLCESGYYEGLRIHRILTDFMIQGGSLNGDGTGGEAMVNDGSFGIETDQNARHFYGALCYANASGINTAQFYIVNDKTPVDVKSDIDLDVYNNIVASGKDYIRTALEDGDEASAASYRQQTQYYQNQIDWVEGATEEILNKYNSVGGVYYLDGNYTVFGQLYEGFDVLDAISAVEVGDNGNGEKSKPIVAITIKSVTVSSYTAEDSEDSEDSDNEDSEN